MSNKNPAGKFIPHSCYILALIFAGLVAYHYSILKGIFLWDDDGLILRNVLIRDFSHLKTIFTTHSFYGSGAYSNFYRPMQTLLLAVVYHFWKLNPVAYHAVVVSLHILVSLLVYRIFLLLSGKRDIAFVTALLFCVHPLHSEIVSYISACADIISLLFYVTTLLCYLECIRAADRNRRIIWYAAALCAYVFAFLSKEAMLTLPLMVLAHWYFFLEPVQKKRSVIRGPLPSLFWSFTGIALLYGALRLTVLNFAHANILAVPVGNLQVPLFMRLLTTCRVLMAYLRLLIFPLGLHMEWEISPASSFFQDEVFLSVLALIVLFILLWRRARRSAFMSFSAAWFFIALIPYYNIIPLPYFMSESWMYIPSIGFFAFIAAFFSDLRMRSPAWSRLVPAFIAVVVLWYGILTIGRTYVWGDPVKLYRETLFYSPNNTKARTNLSALLEAGGQGSEAVALLKESKAINPHNASAYVNTALVYFNSGKYDEALQELEKAKTFDPRDYLIPYDIGLCYSGKGEAEKAVFAYQQSVSLNPDYPFSHNNIGNVYLAQGKYAEAIEEYNQAVRLDPHNALFYANLGRAYHMLRQRDQERICYEKALKFDPNNRTALEGIGQLFLEDQGQKAVK